MDQLSGRYLEDFRAGQTFSSGRLRIDGEREPVMVYVVNMVVPRSLHTER